MANTNVYKLKMMASIDCGGTVGMFHGIFIALMYRLTAKGGLCSLIGDFYGPLQKKLYFFTK